MTQFQERVASALDDSHLKGALNRATNQLRSRRSTALDSLDESETIRDMARAAKMKILKNLGNNLRQFEQKLLDNGVSVHWARDGGEANKKVIEIARARQVKRIVKSKSMVTEEIHLNESLIEAGIDVVETDLGEYIVQLDDDHPSHIIAPIIHKTREDIGKSLHDKLNVPYSDDPEELTRFARQKLRAEFLTADMGITGANFGVVESGTVCLVTNEGNARMVTSMPRIHVVLMGIEKLLASLSDLDLFLKLLARSATGQKLSVYTTLINGPGREPDELPEEMHVIFLDNGRSTMLNGDLAEALACIRCGACLNVCPIYKNIGGHAYGDTYAGPIGSLVTPGLRGLSKWHELPAASTICGACREVCPVRINIPRMLLNLRRETVDKGAAPLSVRLGMWCFGFVASSPTLFRMAAGGVRWLLRRSAKDGWVHDLPLNKGWTSSRDLRRPAERSFQRLWKERLEK